MPICTRPQVRTLFLICVLAFTNFSGCHSHSDMFGLGVRNASLELSRKIDVLDNVLERYDKRAWPTYGTGQPTNVSVNLVIYELGPLNEKDMDFRIDLDLQESWTDERMSLYEHGVNYSFITNEGSLIGSIWKPDIFFVNAKDATTHDITVPNQLLQILPDGVILFSIRITLRLSCLMDFQLFPLDRQICDIVFRPYSHTDEKVAISWRETNPVVLEFSNDAPEFDVINFQIHNFTRFHRTGNFSSLKMEFLLERDPGFYLVHLYLPLTLTVLMSWHALWLKVEIPQARMVLTIQCLLTIVTVSNGARALVPRVSYLKAADVWITACILFVYGTILISTMVNYMARLKLRSLWLRKADQAFADVCHVIKHGTPSDDFLLKMNHANKQEHHRNVKRSEAVERHARYLFPACFLFFNIVYWPFYMLRAYAYF